MARLPALVRQNKVFDLVVAGQSYEQICKKLKVSEDTVARDMQAISTEVQTLVAERRSEILALALAQYSEVVAAAWHEYREDIEREKDWYKGKLDYPTVETSAKTLTTTGEGDGEDAAESAPLEVTTKTSRVRPSYRTLRPQYLRLVIEATREITELTGIKTLTVEHTGIVTAVGMTLEEWKAERDERRAAAEETLALLDDTDNA